jgi:lipid II isoglutaminyl synthase (glutamine-hydrolysing)
MSSINIAWCWPDILNLHGDRGNVMALIRIAEKMGIEAKVHKIVNYGDPIDFENMDIVLFNPGEFKSNGYIINALSAVKNDLDAYIEGNKVLLTVGTTGAAFGKTIQKLDGTAWSGLGYLDMHCKERDAIQGDDLICRMRGTEFELNGSQIQVMDTFLDADIALADVSYGFGNCGYENKQEGARYKNLYFTNILGPILVKNPWFTQWLILTALKNRGETAPHILTDADFDIEYKSMECIRKYNETKHLK